ncbi:biotin--[acetyl-CoA-carboxylase] ligase [Anaerotignum sp.]|uniref:biotin--[acetyl-CoA-carboxylase] ligase n=1 Tax=Anaerotignum sp. TaxID=2039241 RepID=UPI002A90BFF2|nr:biotin--[acetyl-CoA-carboxylase] ligase [Anaerotignum sp.]MCI7657884.1 biotin--[acetyl-CoA-carboxylase] ligase [Clostridia bacterium]MDY5415817.1 biotin--[acetyl-CoA-carboxylase] ligase [Anaerotignum sp.]
MYRILELLRRQEGFLSGEDIGKELSITRAAVWKGIKKLREEGYEIEAVTNRGYRLTNPETMYNKRELEQGLKTKTMGQSIYFYEETDTTNNRARELALEGAPEGTLVIAEKQTAGRGRRGKVWESPLGTGIWMSLVLRPQIMPAEASVLTLLCGLATAEAIEAETGLSAGIKWPNDILINGKKAVGILTEMDCEMSQVHFVIPGIGINVNTASFPPEIAEIATSLYLECGKTVSRRRLVHKVLERLEEHYETFLRTGSFTAMLEDYRKHCITLGKEVHVLGREPFFAEALDITPEGELLVRRADNGKEEVVFSGEVSIRGVI